jgi:hypothetical protein
MHTFKLFSSLDTNDKGLDIYKWKMFPYSLVYKVERWYTYSVGSINDSWDKLKDKFCCEFSPTSHLATLREDIRCFRQKEKQLVGRAWTRLKSSVNSAPPLSILESQLLCNFNDGPNKCSACHLDFGKPFLQRDPAECMVVLMNLVNYEMFRLFKEESESSHESPSTTQSESSTSSPQDLSVETSPKP